MKNMNSWMNDDLNKMNQSMELAETRLPMLLKLTMVTLSGAALLFLLWSALTHVKELARTEGQVLPSGYSQLVQHLEGGLVQEILVHEGDFVEKDQMLVRLDGAGLEEDFREQKLNVKALSLQAERIKAILEKREPDFSGMGASPQSVNEQQRVYETMLAARNSELAVLDQQIAQRKTAIGRLQRGLATAKSNMLVAEESKSIYQNLNQKGLTSRTNLLKRTEEFNSRHGQVEANTAQIEEAKREMDEFIRRREAIVVQQRDSLYTEQHQIELQLAQATQNLKKRNDRVERLEVRAPVSGYVQDLRLNTIGSVIPAGQTLMKIVPMDEKLIVEARILPQQIGRVAPGQEVQVKIDSYDYIRYGTIPAELESVSAMTFVDESRQQEYYKGRVRLSRNYAGHNEKANFILPGMTVDADIVTGEKSVLGYLLKPIQVAIHNSMREQ